MCDSDSSSSSHSRHHKKNYKFNKTYTKCAKIKDLTVLNDAHVNGDVIIDGTLKLPMNVTLNVPSIDYPTIQSAVNHFAGRHAMNGSIIVAPGKYVESIEIDKLSSSLGNNNVNAPRTGFNIVGDTRLIAGVSYVHSGVNTNPSSGSGLGTNLVDVTLSNVANVITITLASGPALDFALAGVVVGDKLKIRNNSDIWTDVTVTSVSGNTLTHNGGTIAIGSSRSIVVVCPNVQILSKTAKKPAIFVSSTAVNITGVWLDTSIANGSVVLPHGTLIAWEGANVRLAGCLFDNSTFNMTGAVMFFFQSGLFAGRVPDPSTYSSGVNTVIGSNPTSYCCLFEGCSSVFAEYLNTFDALASSRLGVFVVNSSQFSASLLQAVSCGQAVQPGFNSVVSLSRLITINTPIGILAAVNSSINLGTSTFTSRIDCNGLVGTAGISCGRGSYLRFLGPVSFSNAEVGVQIQRNSRANVEVAATTPTFTNVAHADIQVEHPSIWDGMRQTATLGNVVTYTGAAPELAKLAAQGMENAYLNQKINAPAPINLPLNPSATAISIQKYLGKTFTITADTAPGTKHTLTLGGGAIFKGYGFSGTTVAKFLNMDAFVTFLVESTSTVRIISHSAMSFA